MTMVRFGFKFQFLLHRCFMVKLIDYVSNMNCDIDSLIDKNCFWILWRLIYLCMVELKWCVWCLNY